MLDDNDIIKLLEAMEIKFPTKLDFQKHQDEYRKDFSDLQTSVDAYAHKADGYMQEMTMLTGKVNRHEKWLMQIAEKLGLKLES